MRWQGKSREARPHSAPFTAAWPPASGKAKAITATTRKLVALVYRALSGRFVYHDTGASGYYPWLIVPVR